MCAISNPLHLLDLFLDTNISIMFMYHAELSWVLTRQLSYHATTNIYPVILTKWGLIAMEEMLKNTVFMSLFLHKVSVGTMVPVVPQYFWFVGILFCFTWNSIINSNMHLVTEIKMCLWIVLSVNSVFPPWLICNVVKNKGCVTTKQSWIEWQRLTWLSWNTSPAFKGICRKCREHQWDVKAFLRTGIPHSAKLLSNSVKENEVQCSVFHSLRSKMQRLTKFERASSAEQPFSISEVSSNMAWVHVCYMSNTH